MSDVDDQAPDIEDIVSRLAAGDGLGACASGNVQLAFATMKQAAEEITRLRAILDDFLQSEVLRTRALGALRADDGAA